MNLAGGETPIWRGGVNHGTQLRPKNQPPVASDDTATVVAGGTVSIPVLANDADPEGGPLAVIAALAATGSVSIGPDGVLNYTAPAGFTGSDTVTYTVADAAVATAEGRVAVTVEAPPNQPPVAGGDTATAVAGGTVLIPVLANDADPEGSPLTVTAATAESGSVSIGADGQLSYTAPAGFTGTDSVTYTVADAAGITAEGRVEVTVTALAISISDSSGDFTIGAADGELTLTVIEPAEYAGDYPVDTADLQLGPVNLLQPMVSGGTAPGDVLTATPGFWAYDEAFGPLVFSAQWYRGDVPIDGATAETYAIQPGDELAGVRYVCHAVNAAGRRSAEIQAIAPGAPESTAPSFSETGVVFGGRAENLVRNADLAPDSDASLWFVSLVPDHTGRQGILRQTNTGNGIEIWNEAIRLSLTVDGATYLLNSRVLTDDQRVHILASMSRDGTGTNRMRLVSRFAGEAGWTDEGSIEVPAEPADLTFGSFAVGGRNAPTNSQNLDAIVYRIAVWAGGPVPDVLDPAVQQAFVAADGHLADPAATHALCGPPRVDLFGPATDYAAGVNHGTAGTFDIVNGSFTDA